MPEPDIADHLVSPRLCYTHHGLYVGQDIVIHYSGFSTPGVSGPVAAVSIAEFASDYGYRIRDHPQRRYSRDESRRRAYTKLGEKQYSLIANNCEHFVSWCIEGDHDSEQLNAISAASVSSIAAVAPAAAIAGVSATGAVAGLSGPGVMAGLASIGSIIGGGAAAGIGVLGAAPGLVTAAVLAATIYKTDNSQPKSEQIARRVGTGATAIGAVAGGAAAVGAVSSLGTVAGLSASGITGGLAAMGGGGMVAGVAVTVAVPAVAAAALGYGAYLLARQITRKSDPEPQLKLPGAPDQD